MLRNQKGEIIGDALACIDSSLYRHARHVQRLIAAFDESAIRLRFGLHNLIDRRSG